MIETLRVRNVGGIASVELDLRGRFVVITGESGAGKSSLARAIELSTGRRAHASIIKAGCDGAEVEVVMADPTSGSVFTVNRAFAKNGRGKIAVGGTWVSLAELTSVMGQKVQMQSQYAQIELLDKALELLDTFGSLCETRGELERTFARVVEADKRLRQLRTQRGEAMENSDKAAEIMESLSGIKLAPGCMALWQDEYAVESERIERMRKIQALLDWFGEGGGVLPRIWQMCEYVSLEDRPSVEDAVRIIEAAAESCERQIRVLDLDYEESCADKIQERAGKVRAAMRQLDFKTEEQLMAYLAECEHRAVWARDTASEEETLRAQVTDLKKQITRMAMDLRELRTASAGELERLVQRHINELAMEGFSFAVSLRELQKLKSSGADGADFMLAGPGQELAAVGKRASGGELSRVLLAMQCAIREVQSPWTLIFDEVEAGLGGKAALLAGGKLREMSGNCQVILITHEATLAAMADRHFVVSRSGMDTNVSEVTGEARCREIARMLSGSCEPEAMKHAEFLLDGGALRSLAGSGTL